MSSYHAMRCPFFPSREKPQDDEWAALKRHQVPLLLNFSQCKLSLEEYKPVIDHCTEVLDFEPGEFYYIHICISHMYQLRKLSL